MFNFLLVFALSNKIYGQRAKTDGSLFEIFIDNKLVLDKFEFLVYDSNSEQELSISFYNKDKAHYNGIVIEPILQGLNSEEHLIAKFEISNHNNRTITFTPKVIIRDSAHPHSSNNRTTHQENGFLLDDVAILSYFDEFTPECASRSYFGNNDRNTLIFEWKPFDMKCNDEITLNLHIVPLNSLKKSKRQIKQNDQNPAFSGSFIPEDGVVHVSDKLKFVGKFIVSNPDPNREVSLYLRDNTGNYPIYKFKNANKVENLEVPIEFEKKISNKTISVYAAYDEYRSENIETNIRVVISPGVYLKENLKRIYNVGETLSVTAFLGDYEPTTYIALAYKFGDINWDPESLDFNVTDYYHIGDNWRTNDTLIEMQLPTEARAYYLYLFAIDGYLDIKNMRIEKIWINQKPNVTEWKLKTTKFVQNGYIDIEAKVYDDSSTFMKYIFDGKEETSNLISWDTCYICEFNLLAEIPIPESITTGTHHLVVYAQDLYNSTSEQKDFSFEMSSDHAPVLEMSSSSPNNLYGYGDNIKFTGVVHDSDQADTIYVEAENESNKVKIFTSNGAQGQVIEYSIQNPHLDSDFTITFRAHDSNGAYSKKISFPVSIRQKKEVIITSQIEGTYKPNSKIQVRGYITDFNPNQELHISYMINGVISQVQNQKVVMGASYLSPEFNFEMLLPSKAGMNTVSIWAESSNDETTYYKNYNIITVADPKILEWLDFNDVYYKYEYVFIRLNVTSDLPVRLCSKIDGGNVNCEENYTELNDSNDIIIWEFNLDDEDNRPLSFNLLHDGEHTVTIYLEDKLGYKSEEMSKTFTKQSDKEVPYWIELESPNYPHIVSDTINFGDEFEIICFTVSDASIYYKINKNDEWTYLTKALPNADGFTIKGSIPVRETDGRYTVSLIAKVDEKHSSPPIKIFFNVKVKKPRIDVKSFNQNKTIEMNLTIIDFPPKSKAKLYYSFDDDKNHNNLINEIIITENGNSENIELKIKIPNDNKKHYLMIWAETDNEKSEIWVKYIDINFPPKLVLHNPEFETYYRKGYIYLNISIWDENNVDIYYQVDPNTNAKKVQNIICNGKNITQVIYIECNDNFVQDNEVDLIIFAQDNYDLKSQNITKRIKYDNTKSSPIIEDTTIITEEDGKQPVFRWADSIEVTFTINDTIENSEYNILYSYDNAYFQFYKKIQNTDEIMHNGVVCKIPSYKKNGDFTLSIQIVRNDGAKSNLAQLPIHIRKKPSIVFLDSLKDVYDISVTNILNIQLRDFEKNSKAKFIMSLLNGDRTFTKVVDIKDNYSSDNFTVPLPNLTAGNYKINFLVKYNSKVLTQTEKNIVFKFAPKFKIMNKDRKKLALNDHINIYFSIQDSDPVDIICEIENITKYIKKDFNPNGKEVHIYEQIFFDNVTIKSLGKDQDVNIGVYARDKFGIKSQIFNYTKHFVLADVAPVMRANSDIGDSLSWYDRPQINAVILAPLYNNNNNNVNIIFRVNYNYIDPITIYKYNSNGTFEKATITLNNIPHENGEFQLSIIAQSADGYSSAFYSKTVKIQKTPHIVLDKLKDHYEPNESVTISGYAVDLDAGMNVDIFYSAEGSSSRSALSSQKLTTSKIYSNFTSSKFSFQYNVPEMENYKGIQIWAESGGHKVAELNNQKDIINYQPKIKIITDVRKEYYDQSSFFFHAKVKDINKIKIFYIIDRSSEISLTDWIECTGSEVTVNSLEIPLLSSQIELGDHRIQIYCRDSNGDMSNVFIYDFVLISRKAPQFEIIESNADQKFSTSDVLTLKCQYLDEYIGNNISLCYTINNNGEILALSEVNNKSEWKTAYLTIVLPYPTNEVVVYALDRTNQVRSTSERMTIKVENDPRVDLEPIILSDSEDRMPGFEYKVYPYSAQLREILPISTPILSSESYYFEFSGKSFSIEQRPAREEYTIGKFVKDHLQNEKDGDLIIKLKDAKSHVTKQFRQKLIFNKAPTLELVKPMEIKIFENGYIDALLKVSGERSVDIYYSIDDKAAKELISEIELDGVSKKIRQQIHTRFNYDESPFGKHTITLYAVDIHGFKSKQLENTVYYYDSNPPSLELSDMPITCTGNIEIEGSVDSSINDDISVYLQKEDFSFEKIHYCPSSSRPQCQSFKYNISKPKDDKLIFQSRGTQGATSKDIVFSYAEVADNCKLLEKFIEKNPTKDKVDIRFIDTIFFKYILWPLLAVIILAIVAGIFIYLKKKKEETNQNSNSNHNSDAVEDEEPQETRIDDIEKLEFVSDDTSSAVESTIEHPLYMIPGKSSEALGELDF